MSLAGEEKLFAAHKTQLKLPIHRGQAASNETGPPLAVLFRTSHTDLFSRLTDEVEANKTVLAKNIEEHFPVQLHDVNVHWLELEMVAKE